jgi:non-catalytic primase subunit PriX-like protein
VKAALPYNVPALTDLELRYPFIAQSRTFFESIPIEDGFASKEVVRQAESRLLNALGRAPYEPHLSELVEFSSFFAAAMVASQDGFLTSKFARKEGERSRGYFAKESYSSKVSTMEACFSARVGLVESGGQQPGYSMGFEEYLALATKAELTKSPRWKLARQSLEEGVVYLSDNLLNDFFGECAQSAIAEGTKNLRRAPFPRSLIDVRGGLLRFVPAQKAKSTKGYAYVDELLKRPVSDGRHRLVWLVLAPYLVNVRKLEDVEAIDKIRAFVSVAGETRDLKRFVEYNVRRARRNGLMPPTLSTLKAEHPDIYSLLPPGALVTELKGRTAKTERSYQ